MLHFRKLAVGKKFMENRGGGGKYQIFLSKTFGLTGPKNFVGEPLSV